MAFIVADRVKETTLTSGTGSIVLNGAFSGFQTFANGIGNGNSTYYVIENKTNWEVGIGTYSSGTNSLSRDTVLRSSAGGAKISLTGVSNVFCSYPATKSVHANPEDFINVVAYSGVKFADATITNSGAYFNNVTSSGSLTLQPQTQGTVPLNIVRTSSGVFFHAYKDDAYDRPVTLYTNGNLSPEWRLGLKSTPNNVYEAPSFGYVYGEDGKVGLFGNNATKLDLLNTSGLYVTHQSNVALKVASNTGVYVNSLGNAYPALSVNGGPALSAPILSLNNYAGSVLTVVDPQGRVGVKTASPAYDLDVNGSGRFNVVHTTSGISFKDGTFQDSAGKTYSAGSGLVLVDTTFHAISTVTSGDIAALVASGIAISGWNKGYTDASVAAVSGWTGTEYVSLHGTYNNPSWLNSISVTKLSGVVDSSNLPSYVDDVLEYSTSGNFPVTGETGKIYVSTDNNRSYRWSGSAYFQLTDTTALWGEITGNIANQTDLTAYVSSVSGWNKSYTDASVAAASGWNKGYTDNSAVAVSGWNKNYTDSQLLAASGYSSGNYVPYIGATQNVDLGSRTLSAGNGTFTGTVTAPTITGSSNLIYVAQNQTFSWDYDTTNTNPALRFTWGGAATTLWGSSGAVNISIQGVNGFRVAPGQTNIASTLGIGSVSSPTVFLRSDSSNTLDIRNSTNAQRFNLYGTYTDASNYRRLYLSSTTAGAFTLGVEGAGTGASGNTLSLANDLRVAGNIRLGSAGVGTSISGFLGPSNDWYALAANAYVISGVGWRYLANGFAGLVTFVNGKWAFTTCPNNTSGADANLSTFTDRLIINGSTGLISIGGDTVSSVPALKRNGTTLQIRLGDDSADAPITAAAGTFSGDINGSSRLVVSGGGGAYGIGTTGHLLQFPLITGFLNLSMGTRGTGFSDRCQLHFQVAHNAQGFAATTEGFYVGSSCLIGFSSGNQKTNAPDVTLYRDTANTLALQGTTNSQTLRIYNTFTDASNYIRQSLSFTTYSSTVHAQLGAEGAGTGAVNIPFVITPRGTGAFILGPMPDGTTTGGNARGANAVDLQTSRAAASHVASGPSSFAANYSNTATGSTASVFGHANFVSSEYGFCGGGYVNSVTTSQGGAVIGGKSNVASGSYANVVLGGEQNTASGNRSTVISGQASTASSYCCLAIGDRALADRTGIISRALGVFANVGDAQGVSFIARNKTTNNTPTTLFLDGSTTRLTIPSGKIFAFVAKISGVKSDGTAAAFYTRKGCIKNVGGTTSLVGTVEMIGNDIEDNGATDIAITADNTNDALQIDVTGITGETWRWVAVVEGVEIGYGT